MIQEEAKLLRVAMGHEDEDIDESVKVASIQKEVDIVKKRMDDETKKSLCLERKIKLRTDGYQVKQQVPFFATFQFLLFVTCFLY